MTTQRFTRSYVLGGLEVDAETRQVDGRIVPYDAPTRIVDEDGDYDEVFTATSLTGMMQGARARGDDYSFVRFNLDHVQQFDHRIGFATDLRSEDDGAYATFELYDSADLPKTLSMLSRSHRGLSIEFGARTTRTRGDGTRERLGVHIFGVAATPTPAYPGANILAVRSDDDVPAAATPVLDGILAKWPTLMASSTPDEE